MAVREVGSSSEGESPSFIRRRREVLEEEHYLKHVRNSIAKERMQLETERGLLEREKTVNKGRAEKERKVSEDHMKTQLVKRNKKST